MTGCRTLCPLTSDCAHAGHSPRTDPHGDWGYTQQASPTLFLPSIPPAILGLRPFGPQELGRATGSCPAKGSGPKGQVGGGDMACSLGW